MRTACFIPIKAGSERVKGKNLRILNGKPLYRYICEHVKEADVFDDVYIDTDSAEISAYAKTIGFEVIERLPELAGNTANGNDLLVHHLELHPEYDYYFQLFATAPYMKPETTGLYGITREALSKYHCRIGRKPYIHIVSKFEAVDINTEEDWKVAEYVGKVIFGL